MSAVFQVEQLRGLTFISPGFLERSADEIVLDAADIALEIDPAFRKVDVWRGPRDEPWVRRVGRARRYSVMGSRTTFTFGPAVAWRLI